MLDERGRCRFAAAEGWAAGRGEIAPVSRITGIARSIIGRGLAELRGRTPPEAEPDQMRRKGAGRLALVDSDPTLPRGSRRPGGAVDPRRPDGTAEVDRQEPAHACGRTRRARPSHLAQRRRRAAARARLQSPGQPQDPRRCASSRPRRPVQLHQRAREGGARGRRAGDLGLPPRRRSWSETSRTAGASGARRAGPNASASTTSSSRNSGGVRPTASTTSPTMPAG